MIRLVLFSVVLLGAILFFIYRWQAMVTRAQPPLVTRVDVYVDDIDYRNGHYATPSTLAIALKANRALPKIVEVHECAAVARLAGVLDVVRAAGADDFQIVLPENC